MKQKRINDRYEIIRPVGGGGMADVFLAKDLILDRYVAVKVLKEQFSKDEEFIRRFRREAQSATSLSHQNVVNIYDVGEEEDLYYIVMEYVEGDTLKEYIAKQGNLTVTESLSILSQIVSAVQHAHENHIIHRDLKPHNILISRDGTAKVTDFGIARAISEATITHTNSVLGSVHYLSPEQARGGQVTYKSDLYSLGVVLFEMISGEVPFQGDTAVSVAIKHLQDPLPKLSDKVSAVPQSVENFIMRATAKDPHKRFQSAEAMLKDLTTVLDPGRRNEKPLAPLDDDDKTKAVPHTGLKNAEGDGETKVHGVPNQAVTKQADENGKPGKKKKGAGFWVKAGIAAILLLAGLIYAVFYLIPGLLHVDDVEIPDNLVGMEYEEAALQLMELNLEVESETRYDDEMEEGLVISHRPGSGQLVKEGTTVNLIVSEGPEPTEMPDLTGQSLQEAQNALENFEEIEVSYEETSDYDDDTVLDQTPEAGEIVIPAETVVRLTVSERPVYIMGNLYNMTRQEVFDSFSGNPLVDIQVDESYHDSIEEGRVISQSPPRGTEIRERTTVEVTFSLGPEPVEEEPEEEPVSAEVPFRVEVPERDEEADENEEPRSFRIRISVTDMEHRTPNQVVDTEITESTTFDIPMTVAPDDSGFIILIVDDEEFEESPYEYTYEELQAYE